MTDDCIVSPSLKKKELRNNMQFVAGMIIFIIMVIGSVSFFAGGI
jgi:hypothetical protein